LVNYDPADPHETILVDIGAPRRYRLTRLPAMLLDPSRDGFPLLIERIDVGLRSFPGLALGFKPLLDAQTAHSTCLAFPSSHFFGVPRQQFGNLSIGALALIVGLCTLLILLLVPRSIIDLGLSPQVFAGDLISQPDIGLFLTAGVAAIVLNTPVELASGLGLQAAALGFARAAVPQPFRELFHRLSTATAEQGSDASD
jgi:hypothetical protein